MRIPRTVALAMLLTKPCQRPGCPNIGRGRLRKGKRISRYLYLCDECLESLLAIELNELFMKFATTLKTDADNRDNETLTLPCPARQKKPYRRPELIEYGNVAQITAGANGSRVDMHNMKSKT